MLTGKNLIACAPSDAAEGRFTAGGALAEFQASSAHVDHDEWFERFVRRMEILIGEAPPGTMLYPAIFESYAADVERLSALGDTRTVRSSMGAGVPLGCARGKQACLARPSLFAAGAETNANPRRIWRLVEGEMTRDAS